MSYDGPIAFAAAVAEGFVRAHYLLRGTADGLIWAHCSCCCCCCRWACLGPSSLLRELRCPKMGPLHLLHVVLGLTPASTAASSRLTTRGLTPIFWTLVGFVPTYYIPLCVTIVPYVTPTYSMTSFPLLPAHMYA